MILGWPAGAEDLWKWLSSNGFIVPPQSKPPEPKAALHDVLRLTGRRPTANLFGELAERLSLRRCEYDAFRKFTLTLQQWFPP